MKNGIEQNGLVCRTDAEVQKVIPPVAFGSVFLCVFVGDLAECSTRFFRRSRYFRAPLNLVSVELPLQKAREKELVLTKTLCASILLSSVCGTFFGASVCIETLRIGKNQLAIFCVHVCVQTRVVRKMCQLARSDSH